VPFGTAAGSWLVAWLAETACPIVAVRPPLLATLRGALSTHLRSLLEPLLHSLRASHAGGKPMLMLFFILLLIAALLSIPSWPYSRGWGYYPSGGLGVIAAVLLIIFFMR
jgi:hypothetical protein